MASSPRPQRVDDRRQVREQGYDLMLVIDLSGSMLAEDNHRPGEGPNRLQVIKPVIRAFIENRPSDRIGIVVFATQAYTLSPLTFDHAWLARQLDRLEIGVIDADHTAIGDGLGVALTRLEQSGREEGNRRKGAFVVLQRTGDDTSGKEWERTRKMGINFTYFNKNAAIISVPTAAPARRQGAGRSKRLSRTTGYTQIMADLDEGALTSISEQTGGRFFRARDANTIESAFKSIDQAQKIEFAAKSYLLTTELFPWFAVPGFVCLLSAGLILAWSTLRGHEPTGRSPSANRSRAVS